MSTTEEDEGTEGEGKIFFISSSVTSVVKNLNS